MSCTSRTQRLQGPSAWVLVLCEVSLSRWNSKCPEVPGGVSRRQSRERRELQAEMQMGSGGMDRSEGCASESAVWAKGSPAGRWRGRLQSGAWRIGAQESRPASSPGLGHSAPRSCFYGLSPCLCHYQPLLLPNPPRNNDPFS